MIVDAGDDLRAAGAVGRMEAEAVGTLDMTKRRYVEYLGGDQRLTAANEAAVRGHARGCRWSVWGAPDAAPRAVAGGWAFRSRWAAVDPAFMIHAPP